jgi:electron transfer flavoprotein beta subunit
MNVIVCMKQVVDLEQIRIKADTRQPVLDGLPVLFGDFDKCALEEAVRIKEKQGGKVTAVAAGTPKLKDTIKEALAIGADEAVLMTDAAWNAAAFQGSGSAGSAALLAKAIEKIGAVDLILLGDGSADNYSGQVPPRLAEILGLPQIGAVRQMEVLDGKVRAVRDLEDALEVVEVDLPAVISVTSEINTPRLPPLSAILKAGRKPVQIWGPNDLGDASTVGVTAGSGVEVLSNLAPVLNRKQVIFEDAAEGVVELVKALQREGVLER